MLTDAALAQHLLSLITAASACAELVDHIVDTVTTAFDEFDELFASFRAALRESAAGEASLNRLLEALDGCAP